MQATLRTKPATGDPLEHSLDGGCRKGVSDTTVHRIWKAHRLQPHRVETIQVQPGSACFVEKVRDVVGLYAMNPPEKALVYCCVDEKSQIRGARSDPAHTALAFTAFRNDKRTTTSATVRPTLFSPPST